MRKFAWSMAMALAFCSPAAAQSAAEEIPAYRKRLLGVYNDRTGDVVADADVIAVLSGLSMKTTSSGTVALVILPEGGGLIRVRKVGFEPQTMMVSISPEDTVPVTIILKPVTELAAMSVVDSSPRYMSSTLRGFEERRRNAASGTFIPESAIRKEDTRSTGSLIVAKIAGARVVQARGNRAYLMASARCGAGGPPAVYIDGALLAKDSNGPSVDLNQFSLTTLAAIEYYPNTATAPPQYNGTAGSCGALLLWTREK